MLLFRQIYCAKFYSSSFISSFHAHLFSLQAILKTNKWKKDYNVAGLTEAHQSIKKNLALNKARVLKHRDMQGRPVVVIPARNHDASTREIEELTQFIVYCLVSCQNFFAQTTCGLRLLVSNLQEEASKKCFEDVVDNLCIVFDLKNFSLSCMDYPLIKNLIWLLSRHYPERLGVCLICNYPTVFSGCWAVIRGWLDENTSSKVVFVSSEEQLCQYLIPDILPADL